MFIFQGVFDVIATAIAWSKKYFANLETLRKELVTIEEKGGHFCYANQARSFLNI